MRTVNPNLIGLAVAALLTACGGAGTESAGPQQGSAQWYLDAAWQNYDIGDFSKVTEHLEAAVKLEGPEQHGAVLLRTVVLAGLSRGSLEVVDVYREAGDKNPKLIPDYQNPVQQAQRDGRRYAIDLAESLGAVDKALSADSVALDFPFPGGAAIESNVTAALRRGETLPESQLLVAG